MTRRPALVASSLLAASASARTRLRCAVVCCAMTTALAGCVDDGLFAYDCAVFPPSESSPYILPWMIGASHRAIPHAAKTSPNTPQKYAIDVLMPIGTPVIAMRDGVVVRIEESFVDGDNVPRHENYVFVEHEDATVGRYVHLTYGGAVFGIGDRVRQGEVIGYSGHTGNSTEPHLHVDVTRSCCAGPPDTEWNTLPAGETLPLSFRNATAAPPRKTDLSCGLLYGVSYTAEPY